MRDLGSKDILVRLGIDGGRIAVTGDPAFALAPAPREAAEARLAAAGLDTAGLNYPDLILSLLVDRLHHLLTYTPDTVLHLVEMLM